MGVHVHSLQGWEAGVTHPSAANLQALIAACLAIGCFTSGQELAEAAGLWAAVRREAPRLRTPFDLRGFADLPRGRSAPAAAPLPTPADAPTERPALHGTPNGISLLRRQDWGEAPDVAGFLGRQ